MSSSDDCSISEDVRAGRVLHGNDYVGAQLEDWFAAEEEGYFRLKQDEQRERTLETYEYRAQNEVEAGPLRDRSYAVALALGPAEGHDLLTLGLDIERIVAIEPAEGFWSTSIGGIPTEWHKPDIDGTLPVADSSVDLVISLGVLHHVPNVERVVEELGRVLKPGGRFIVREPAFSMGDWTKPRRRLTRNERGIPRRLMQQFLARAGLKTERQYMSQHGLMRKVWQLGFNPYLRSWAVRLDHLLSKISWGKDLYWRTRSWEKVAPALATYLGSKPAT